MKTIAYIMSTYHIGTHNLDIRYILDIENILKSYIIAKRKNNHLKQRTYENNKSFIKNHNQSEW